MPAKSADSWVKILEEVQDYALGKLFRIIRATFRYRRFDGRMSEPITRINFERGESVGVLLYDPEDDAVDLDGIGDRDLDFVEIYGSLSFMDATLGLAYSPDYFYETDSYIYLYGDYSYAINDDWSLDVHAGLNLFDDEEIGADFGIGRCSAVATNGECLSGTEDSYADWSIGISTTWSGLDFTLQYVDTDLDDKDCFGNTQLCDATAVISVSKSL